MAAKIPGKIPFTKILGWSASRYDTFSACRRQYYYQYYDAHDREFPHALIRKLKDLTSLPLETGRIVHDVIAAVLERLQKSRDMIDKEKFAAYVEKETATRVREKTFSEVHYGETQEVTIGDLLPTVEECLASFLKSSRFEWIRNVAAANAADWIIEPEGYGEARIDGMKVYCKVDFLFPQDGEIVILDWKTGKLNLEKHRKQLTGYAAWAMHHLGRPACEIRAILAFLRPEYREIDVHPSEEELTSYADKVRVETEHMYALCADVQENLPKAKEAFPMTQHLGICSHCNFRELCGR